MPSEVENRRLVAIRLREFLVSGCQNGGDKVKGFPVLAGSESILYGIELPWNLDLITLGSSSVTSNEQYYDRTEWLDTKLALFHIAGCIEEAPFRRSKRINMAGRNAGHSNIAVKHSHLEVAFERLKTRTGVERRMVILQRFLAIGEYPCRAQDTSSMDAVN